MFTIALMLLIQAAPAAPPQKTEATRIMERKCQDLPAADDNIAGPYRCREDQGQTTKVVLRNGLTVIVREQHAVPLAAVTTLVKAGYFDEEDRLSGISHVIEHMFFKGTTKRPVGEIARETKALGGHLNAYTYYDRTVYYTVVPAENALKALEIQADALWRPSFDAGELAKEIEVVIQENNRKLDNPSAFALEKLYSIAFEQHPMRRWRIGTPEGLRALTRDDVVGYYQRFYRPSNVILVVAGQVDREQILAEVVKQHGSVPEQTVDRPGSPAEPPQAGVRYASQQGPIEQNHVAFGFHGPGIASGEARTLEVLASVLSDGRASRLNQYLRDEKGLITSGAAGLRAFQDMSFFEIAVETASPREAHIGLLAELEQIKRFGVSNEAVARAKAQIAQDYLRRLETVNGIAEELAYYEALGGWAKSGEYFAEIQKVTPQRVLSAARKYLTPENMSVFEYLPASGSPTAQAGGYEAVLQKAASGVIQREEVELPVSAAIPAVSIGGGNLAVDYVRPIQRRSILRGPDVYIVEDHRLPLVSFGIFYPGGRLLESAKNAGITELMLRTALRGTQRLSSKDISRRLENAGATIRVVNEPDFFGYIVEGLSARIGEALETLMDVLQQPRFDDAEVESEKAIQTARIKDLRENNAAYPVSLMMKTLFGDHGYAWPSVGAEESVSKLKSADLQDWFKRHQRPVTPTIVIVGDTTGTGLIAAISDPLTNEDLRTRDMAAFAAPQLPKEKREAVEATGRQQTALVYGFPGVSLTAPDRAALVVVANVVSGLGGRFFDAIREKQGLAYTVRTSNEFFVKGGAVYTYTAFSPEKEAEVRAALEQEIDRLRKEGVTPEELKKAAAYSVGEREIALQTRGAQVLEYARAVYSGAGVQAVPKFSEQLRAVTAERVRTAAFQYFNPELLRVAVVRGGVSKPDKN